MKLKQELTPQILADLINPPESKSLQVIGEMFGVSRQRVHQILNGYKKEHPHLFVKKALPSALEMTVATSLSELSRQYGVSVNRIKSLMKKASIEREPLTQKISEETLRHLYVQMEWGDKEIAELFGCSQHTVMKLRYGYGIHATLRLPLETKLSKERFVELYVEQGFLLTQIASVYGVGVQRITSLKKQYGIQRTRNPHAEGATPEAIDKASEELLRSIEKLRNQQPNVNKGKEDAGSHKPPQSDI